MNEQKKNVSYLRYNFLLTHSILILKPLRICTVKKTETNDRGDPLRWPRDTVYPQKLALTSPTSGGRSVSIVRSRTKATECSLV
jgi:hypothetical protein